MKINLDLIPIYNARITRGEDIVLNTELVKNEYYSLIGFDKNQNSKQYVNLKYSGGQIFEKDYNVFEDKLTVILAIEKSSIHYNSVQVIDFNQIEIQSIRYNIDEFKNAYDFIKLEDKLKEYNGIPIKFINRDNKSFMTKGFVTLMINKGEVLFEFKNLIFKKKIW